MKSRSLLVLYICVQDTAGALQDCDFDVKSLLTPTRKADVSGGIHAGYLLAGQPSIVAIIHTMAAKQGNRYQTLIHELSEKEASRAA
jgi:hypothetical protein